MLGTLDTLETVKRLKEAGFSDAQAEAVTNVLRDERESRFAGLATEADLAALAAATKADFAAVRAEMAGLGSELRSEIAALGSELRSEIAALGSELRSEMAQLRHDLEAGIRGLDTKIEILRRDLTIRLGSMLVVATGVLLAAKFFG